VTTSTVDVTRDAVAAAVQEWLGQEWTPDLPLVEWRQRLLDSGWAVPSAPKQWYGRALPAWADEVVQQEIRAAGAVGKPLGPSTGLAWPTIMAHGADELRRRFLGPILTGQETWCQLFSEPAAGSDLAGLTTTAKESGSEWIVSGEKVWTTSAHHADFGLLLARTDSSATKHEGLTFFVLPMHQPGIEVRPLRQMNGHASFNQVFLTEARIPIKFVIGEVGKGWPVALTTLANERRFGHMTRVEYPATGQLAYREAQAESDEHFRTYEWYPQRAGRADLVIGRARATGRLGDPVVRQEIAKLLIMDRASRWTAERFHAARAAGEGPGPEGSLGKLASSHIARQAAAVHTMIHGADAMLTGPDSPLGGVIAEVFVSTPAQSIAGGTDQIQRNIVGEKILGLPREPSVDRGRPFSELPRGG
jgi:alkylation response protein AidB-like acyl-CoA dehydrogenase